MKVKIFSSESVSILEKSINKFLETVPNVVDIKYSSSDKYSEALIIYDENKAAE